MQMYSLCRPCLLCQLPYHHFLHSISVDWTNKRNSFEEGRLTDEIATLNKEIEKETRINVEMESFIGLHQAELEQQVEMWMDKYEKDYDNKIKGF